LQRQREGRQQLELRGQGAVQRFLLVGNAYTAWLDRKLALKS
jgi:hypothetical protein